MRIIGIDPGTGRLGFGVIDIEGSKVSMVDAGVITTSSTDTNEKRLKDIYDDLNSIIDETKPTIMSVEKLFFAKNVTTAMTVSQARGVVLLLAEHYKLEVREYTPLQIKHAITGYGRADKRQVQEMVKILLGLKSIPQPDDCADALAAALMCARAL